MAHKYSELTKNWPAERRARVEAATRKLLAELPLEELRRARHLTQVQLAEQMGATQASISKMEKRTDMYISTLAHFIEAMGGSLEIRAVFPDGEVKISQFNDLAKSS